MKVLDRPKLSMVELLMVAASPAIGWCAWEFAGGVSGGVLAALTVTLTGISLVGSLILAEQYVLRRRRTGLSFGEIAWVAQSVIVAAIVGAFAWHATGRVILGLLFIQCLSGIALAPTALVAMSMEDAQTHMWLDFVGPIVSVLNSAVVLYGVFGS